MAPLTTVAQAAPSTPVWLTVAIGVAGAVATVMVFVGGAISKERTRRREMYAHAVRSLIGWAEYPYQVRRRTSDDADEIARLCNLGHELQQDTEYYQSILGADKPFLGDLYADVITQVKTVVGPWITDAWAGEPITEPAAMNLDGWGPPSLDGELKTLRAAIRNRFGWKRVAAAVHLRHPRLPDNLP